MAQSEKETALFIGLVVMYQAAAMQHLGKTKNPITDKVERDLEQAQFVIDTLDALASKTKGNLTDDESRFLTNALRELKLNYVDEITKDQRQGSSSEPKEPTTTEEKP